MASSSSGEKIRSMSSKKYRREEKKAGSRGEEEGGDDFALRRMHSLNTERGKGKGEITLYSILQLKEQKAC